MANEFIVGAVKRYLIPILAILVLASGLLLGCSQSEKPSSTTSKGGASLSKQEIRDYVSEWVESKALNKTMGEALRWSSALYWETTEYEYIGNHEWVVTIPYPRESEDILAGSKWAVNEVTREVRPLNDWAILTLFVMTHEIYKNPSFGYSLVYPCGWQVKTQDKNAVIIMQPNNEAFIRVSVREVKSLSIKDEALFAAAVSKSIAYEFVLVASEPEVKEKCEAWVLTYILRLDKNTNPFRLIEHFILKNEYIYDVTFAASNEVSSKYAPEFNLLYSRFSLQ
jgi:hypothetical protein